jgi:hypothetical protein
MWTLKIIVMISQSTPKHNGAAVPYSPSRERKRSWPNNVCTISNVNNSCVPKFKGAAIVSETKMVNWSVFSSPGRRNPCEFVK